MIVVSAPWGLETFDALVSPTRFLNSPITPSQTHFPRIIRRCFMIKKLCDFGAVVGIENTQIFLRQTSF